MDNPALGPNSLICRVILIHLSRLDRCQSDFRTDRPQPSDRRRRVEGAEEHPRRRCSRAGDRRGVRLTGDCLAKWPERATLMLIDVRIVAARRL